MGSVWHRGLAHSTFLSHFQGPFHLPTRGTNQCISSSQPDRTWPHRFTDKNVNHYSLHFPSLVHNAAIVHKRIEPFARRFMARNINHYIQAVHTLQSVSPKFDRLCCHACNIPSLRDGSPSVEGSHARINYGKLAAAMCYHLYCI